MSVIGNRPVSNFQRIAKQTITGTGATAYSLDRSISSAADLAVFVNNVRQEPGIAYTASTTTITFSEAITGSDTVYVLYIGQSIGTVAHPSDQPLSATTGTFSGALSGTTGTFSGALSGTTGTFTGDVYAPGHVIQTVYDQDTTSGTGASTTSTSHVTTGLSATITPKSTSSIIVGWCQFNYWFGGATNSDYCVATMYRGAINIAGLSQSVASAPYSPPTGAGLQWYAALNPVAQYNMGVSFPFKDAPSTTSSTTYTLYIRTYAGSTVSVNWDNQQAGIILQEIAQ